jgi:hypothetical protein
MPTAAGGSITFGKDGKTMITQDKANGWTYNLHAQDREVASTARPVASSAVRFAEPDLLAEGA